MGAQSYQIYIDWKMAQMQIKQHITVSTFLYTLIVYVHTVDSFCEQPSHDSWLSGKIIRNLMLYESLHNKYLLCATW